ncbi:MAG: UvrD-helicase domain-containing protein, partial [Sphingorhabdus sp.]
MSDPEPKKVHQLTNAQQAAVEPADNIWLSASAGSGKTQVLSARVIRLMLSPQVRPENLLCLTFTKAAAAEMADRINRKLASWV